MGLLGGLAAAVQHERRDRLAANSKAGLAETPVDYPFLYGDGSHFKQRVSAVQFQLLRPVVLHADSDDVSGHR